MPFEFATATRVIFGAGALNQLGPAAAAFGHRALVVIGSKLNRVRPALDQLASHGVSPVLFQAAGEPTIALAEEGAAAAQREACALVVAIGGGSAIDAGKAIAALATNAGPALDYLEVIGRAQPLKKPPLPFIAVPTTAGSGAEVTRNAVLASPEHKMKVSLRSPHMLPRLALVDPELTLGLPPAATAATGMDALSQLIEPFVSNRANPIADALCREGMGRAARALRRAYERGDDRAAREDMSLAALLGGMALANAGLGAVHGFASPIGGQFPAPHGAVCARLLPRVVEANLEALRVRAPDSAALARYDEAARILTGSPRAQASDAVVWLDELTSALGIPRLGAYGLTRDDVGDVVSKAAVASSMKANPIALTIDELAEVLYQAL